jgi:hypothetical protein
MQVFTYNFFYKLIYKFGNIAITILLLVYLIPVALNLDKDLILIIPFVVSLIIIYYVNKKYLDFYKIVPYKIEADDNKIVCSDFSLRRKVFTIYYKDIESLMGGIFDAKHRGLMQVYDGKNKICIGFFDRMTDSNKLVTIILSKVDKKIYDEVIDKLQSKKIMLSEKKK